MGKVGHKALASDGLNYIYKCGLCLRMGKAEKRFG